MRANCITFRSYGIRFDIDKDCNLSILQYVVVSCILIINNGRQIIYLPNHIILQYIIASRAVIFNNMVSVLV